VCWFHGVSAKGTASQGLSTSLPCHSDEKKSVLPVPENDEQKHGGTLNMCLHVHLCVRVHAPVSCTPGEPLKSHSLYRAHGVTLFNFSVAIIQHFCQSHHLW
jgi:hypothetical protein